MSLIERANKILIKNNKSPLIIKRNIPDIDNYNFCLYRFLDEEGKVIYLGKCTRSVNSDKRGYTKNYFLNERLKHHFAPSSKQNPKSLYLNVAKIEILLPNVSSNEELEKFIQSSTSLNPQQLVYEILNYTTTHDLKSKDDMTLIVLKIQRQSR